MDQQLLDSLTQFVSIVALATLPVVAAYLARWIKVKIAVAHAELDAAYPSVMGNLEWFAAIAVDAAEAAGLKDMALDKKQFAIDLAEKFLATKKITVDLDLLDAAIEAAWIEAYGPVKLEASANS
jgi:hypothetical protein